MRTRSSAVAIGSYPSIFTYQVKFYAIDAFLYPCSFLTRFAFQVVRRQPKLCSTACCSCKRRSSDTSICKCGIEGRQKRSPSLFKISSDHVVIGLLYSYSTLGCVKLDRDSVLLCTFKKPFKIRVCCRLTLNMFGGSIYPSPVEFPPTAWCSGF